MDALLTQERWRSTAYICKNTEISCTHHTDVSLAYHTSVNAGADYGYENDYNIMHIGLSVVITKGKTHM